MARLKPTIHPDYPLETKVKLNEKISEDASLHGITGTIVGVAFQHIYSVYIVLLDQPIFHNEETHRAIAVPGQCLDTI